MHTWQDQESWGILKNWINSLKPHGVYFSEPLDLDLAMLEAFPDAYQGIIPKNGGPRMKADKAAELVLGAEGPGLKPYTGPLKDYPALLPAYRYHFLTNSKPATHLEALPHIQKKDLKENMPAVLAEVLHHIAKSLRRD